MKLSKKAHPLPPTEVFAMRNESSSLNDGSLKTRRRLSVVQLAEYLEVSQKTIYGWVYRGLITPQRIGPRLIRFDVEEIEKWIASQNAKEKL